MSAEVFPGYFQVQRILNLSLNVHCLKLRLRVSLPGFALDIKSANKKFVWFIPSFIDGSNETSSPVSVPDCGGLSDSFGPPCDFDSFGVSQDMLRIKEQINMQ